MTIDVPRCLLTKVSRSPLARRYLGGMPVEIAAATAVEHDELFDAFSRIIAAGEGFPQAAPLTRAEFDDYWIAHSSAVCVARFGGYFVGAYYIKPNFVGRAAHIANAGYFVLSPYRGTGVGRAVRGGRRSGRASS